MREEMLQDLSSEIKVFISLTEQTSFHTLCKEKEIAFLLNQFDEIVREASHSNDANDQEQLVPLQIVSAHRVQVKKQEIARLSGLLEGDVSVNEELVRNLQTQSENLNEMMKACQEKCLALGL
jgi:Nnf1